MLEQPTTPHRSRFNRTATRCLIMALTIGALLCAHTATAQIIDPGVNIGHMVGDPVRNVFYASLGYGDLISVSFDTKAITKRVSLPKWAQAIAITPDGSRLYLASGEAPEIFVYSLPDLVFETSYLIPMGEPADGSYIWEYQGIAASNTRLYAVSDKNWMAVVDTTTGETLFLGEPLTNDGLTGRPIGFGDFPAITMRPDGTSVIVWEKGWDEFYHIYDVSFDQPVLIGANCCLNDTPQRDIAFSPDGTLMYTASYALRVLANTESGLPQVVHHGLIATPRGYMGSALAVSADGNTVYAASQLSPELTVFRTSDWLPYHVGSFRGAVLTRRMVLSLDQQTLAAAISTSTGNSVIEMISVVDLEVNRGAARVVPWNETYEVPFYDGWTEAEWGKGNGEDNVDWALTRGPAPTGTYPMTVGGAWWLSTETVSVDIAAGYWTDVGEVVLTGHTDWPLPVSMCTEPAAEIGRNNHIRLHGHGFHEDVDVFSGDPDITINSFGRDSLDLINIQLTIDENAEPGKLRDAIGVSNPGEAEDYYSELMIIPVGQSALAFAERTYTVNEGDGTATIEVVRTGSPEGTVGVEYYTLPGTATDNVDYTPQSSSLSWNDLDTTPRQIVIPITEDPDIEGDETFTVELTNPTGGALLGIAKTTTVTIDDNDDSNLGFSTGATVVSEDGGTVTVYVTRTGNLSYPAGASYATAAGTATEDVDYTGMAGTVSWNSGENDPRPIDVVILDDSAQEGDESFKVQLSNPTGNATLSDIPEATVYIEDDDQPSFRFTSASSNVGEGSGVVNLTVERLGPLTGAVSVGYASADASAEAGADYVAANGTLNWAIGDDAAKTIPVTITPDSEVEGDESFTVSLENPSTGAVIREPATAAVTIIDDDCSIHFASAAYYVDEGFNTITVEVLRTGNDAGAVSASYAVSGGSAGVGSDFESLSGIVAWEDGDDTSREISFTVYEDDLVEGTETAILSLSNPVGDAAIGSPGNATITIFDDDLTEFRANQTIVSQQTRPSVGLDALGRAVATWDSYLQDGSGWGVYGVRYDELGIPLGEFQIANTTAGDQRDVAVAMAPSGAFVAVWESPDAMGTGIYMRRYSAAGTPLAIEQLVNTTTNFEQTTPAVAIDAEGRILVVWESGDADGSGIFAQAFTAAGVKNGGQRQLNATTAGAQVLPAVAALPGVGFVAVWQSYGQDGPANGIVGRRLGVNGAPIDGEWVANTLTSGNQEDPAVAANGNGFVVVWKDATHQDGSSWSIRMQRFSTTAVKVGSETGVNVYGANAQYDPAVAVDDADTALVAWVSDEQDGSVEGVFMRFMPLEGSPSGDIKVNLYTIGTQDEPALACASDGSFFAAWSSGGQDGSGDGVFGSRGMTPDFNLIFKDDFEAGETIRWSASAP